MTNDTTNSNRVRSEATVVLRADPLAEDDGFGRECCHMSGVEMNELGVWLDWAKLGGKSFFPWSNVVRVDVDECTCGECRRAAEELRIVA